MQKVTVLLLAGQRPKPGPICEAYKVSYKSLVPIAGQPMIFYPLTSLGASKNISEIIILAQEPEVISKGLSDFQIGDKVKYYKSNGSIAHSVLSCIQELKLGLPLMVTTADNCLLRVDDIDSFLTQAFNSSADFAVGFAQKEMVTAAYPEIRRTWIPFSDVKVTGCNLFLLTSDKSRDLISFWKNFEMSPKKYLKLAWALGPAFFWYYLRRKLTISESFKRISSITGAKVMPLLMKNPAVSIDADKISDILQIESVLNRDNQFSLFNPNSHQPGRSIVIFDLDRTITRNATYTPFLVYYALRQNFLRLLYAPLVLILMIAYTLKLLDRKQLKSRMFGLIIGHPDKLDLDRICTAYVDSILDNNVHPDALYTIREWQKKNAQMILATASFDWMADIFARRLKFDNVIATKSIVKNGKVFPGVDGENCYGEAKLRMVADALGSLTAGGHGKQEVWFYTDHHTDIPLLDICNHPVAVNASRKLGNWIKSRPNGISLDWHTSPPGQNTGNLLFASIGMLCLAVLLFASVSSTAERQFRLVEVPDVVMQAVNLERPSIDITEASVEFENDSIVYELEGTSGGTEYEIEVTAEGKILEVSTAERQIRLVEVPDVVMQAVNLERPSIDITEASVEFENDSIVYELEGTSGGTEYEIEVTAEGKILEIEKHNRT